MHYAMQNVLDKIQISSQLRVLLSLDELSGGLSDEVSCGMQWDWSCGHLLL